MGKKGNRKNNKQHLMPELTLLDKSIYILCLIFAFFITMFFMAGIDYIRNLIAFSKPDTVAYISNASNLWSLPFFIFLLISAFVFCIFGWVSKKPIFGSKKIKYGEFPYKEDCYPIFCRNKHSGQKTTSEKKLIRSLAALWCAVLIVLAGLIPLSLFSRNAIYQDNSIEKINFINNVSDTYTADDFSRLTISAEYVRRGRGVTFHWIYDIRIEMTDGTEVYFCRSDFGEWGSNSKKDVALDKMLEIKGLFAREAITVNGAEYIDNVSNELNFNEQQQAKLAELFSE